MSDRLTIEETRAAARERWRKEDLAREAELERLCGLIPIAHKRADRIASENVNFLVVCSALHAAYAIEREYKILGGK